MQFYLFLLITSFGCSMFSQECDKDELVGNWKVRDIRIKELTMTSCIPEEGKTKLADFLNKNYLGASFVLYNTNQLIYYSNGSNDISDKNPLVFTELINFKWRILTDCKIEITNFRNKHEKSAVDLKYKEGKLYFELFEIEFRMEKL